MTRGQRKAELVAIVADLIALRYRHSDIARVVGRTPQRIGQIAADIGMMVPLLRSRDDLPPDIRGRVEAFLAFDSEATPEQ